MKYTCLLFSLLTLASHAKTLPVRIIPSDEARLSIPRQTEKKGGLLVAGSVQRFRSSPRPLTAHVDICLLNARGVHLACRKESFSFPGGRRANAHVERYAVQFKPQENREAALLVVKYESDAHTMHHGKDF